jgi:hypothetical protein
VSDSKTEALQIAHAALRKASGWLQGEYAKGPDTPGARVQIAVNDALGEVSRVLRLHGGGSRCPECGAEVGAVIRHIPGCSLTLGDDGKVSDDNA